MGGWAVFNGFFAENAGLVEESCAPYKAESSINQCNLFSQCKEVARVSKTYHIAEPTEEGIQKEILMNGMVILDIVTPAGYQSFTTGILKEELESERKSLAPTHAINCVGWGEEKGEKYWIIRNAYGEYFGDKGDVKILRGVNLYQIE